MRDKRSPKDVCGEARNSGLKCLSTGSLPSFPFTFLAIFSPNREPVNRLVNSQTYGPITSVKLKFFSAKHVTLT